MSPCQEDLAPKIAATLLWTNFPKSKERTLGCRLHSEGSALDDEPVSAASERWTCPHHRQWVRKDMYRLSVRIRN